MGSLWSVAPDTEETGAALTRSAIVCLSLEADCALYTTAVFVVIFADRRRRQTALDQARFIAALLLPATALSQLPAALFVMVPMVLGPGGLVSSRQNGRERGTRQRLDGIAAGAVRDQGLRDAVNAVVGHLR